MHGRRRPRLQAARRIRATKKRRIIMFKKAERQQSKLRLCISGPTGSGKTMGALYLASSIKGDGKIAYIDTENGSASLYSDRFEFDVLNMEPPYHPDKFVEAIKAAESAGYSVVVIDSATHEWDGAGGCLELNEKTARAKFKGNTWSAWSDTTIVHQRFIDAIVQSKCHVIACARSKMETAQEGKRIIRLGTKLVQREGFEYEFTLALDITHGDHFAVAMKDRTGLFIEPEVITEETGKKLISWLNDGKSIEEIIKSHIADIASAPTITDLQERFKTSLKIAKQSGDQSFIDRIVSAKDTAKLLLEPEVRSA